MFPPVSRPHEPGRSGGGSVAEHEWRLALRDAGFQIAPSSVPFHWTSLQMPGGDLDAAEDAYRAFAAAEPENLVALRGLLFLLQSTGRADAALGIRRRIVEVEVREMGIPEADQASAVEFLLAKAGAAPMPASGPPAYLAHRFDEYADEYEEHVLESLGYAGHRIIRSAVEACFADSDEEPPVAAALDLGCGTGLAGEELRPLVGRLEGVDLSPQMLERARAKGVYDDLACEELVVYLDGRAECYDLVVAADVFTYVGDLAPAFEAVAAALRDAGVLVLTVETCDGESPQLLGNGHYAHPRPYVEACAGDAGLSVAACDGADLRREHGTPVPALCFTLRRG